MFPRFAVFPRFARFVTRRARPEEERRLGIEEDVRDVVRTRLTARVVPHRKKLLSRKHSRSRRSLTHTSEKHSGIRSRLLLVHGQEEDKGGACSWS